VIKALPVFLGAFIFTTATGQYYYNDIVSTQQGNELFKSLRTNKVHKIRAASFEPDNSATEGFSLEEDISLDGKKVVLSAATSAGNTSVTNRFYELNRLKRVQVNSRNIDNRTDYNYDAKAQVVKLVFTTTDTAMKSTVTETHDWTYGDDGQPLGMTRIKNRVDTMQVELVKDEQGQVVEERWKKKNRVLETYYYYYDGAKHITDIVRYNLKLKKLMPDFQYEYDPSGRVTQMIQFTYGNASYITWKYTYNEKGLKKQETGFDKEKKLIGRIEYTYE